MRAAGGASGAFVLDLDADGDGALYGNDADERRVPASNEKLFTTAAFLDALGPKAPPQDPRLRQGQARAAPATRPSRATW